MTTRPAWHDNRHVMAEPANVWKRRGRVYPELLLLRSDTERLEVLRQARRSLMLKPLFALKFALTLAVLLAVSLFLLDAMPVSPVVARLPRHWSRTLTHAIVGAVCGASSMWVLQYLLRNAVRSFLRRRLLELRIPVCRGCGYDLRGQTTPRCPECGREFPAEILTWQDGPP